MAPIAGFNGSVDFGTIVDSDVAYRTHAWSTDISADSLDTTDFTSAGWREFIAGLKSWSGTVEMYVDSTNRIVPSDVGNSTLATITLDLDGTSKLQGKAFVTSWNPAVTVDGVETQSLGFQGTSDLFAV